MLPTANSFNKIHIIYWMTFIYTKSRKEDIQKIYELSLFYSNNFKDIYTCSKIKHHPIYQHSWFFKNKIISMKYSGYHIASKKHVSGYHITSKKPKEMHYYACLCVMIDANIHYITMHDKFPV